MDSQYHVKLKHKLIDCSAQNEVVYVSSHECRKKADYFRTAFCSDKQNLKRTFRYLSFV
jgi:hypothetical protein